MLRLNLLSFLALAGALAIGTDALGAYLDVFPEYETMSESEPGSFDSIEKIDSEYQSDALAYAPPIWSETLWLSRTQGFELTDGSLSSHHFFDVHRLKLRKRIAPKLDFKFVYFRQRDFETDSSHAVLELEMELHPQVFVALYGEPAFYKRQDDVGAAAIYRPRRSCEARAFYTWVDMTRRQLSDRPDNFIEGEEPSAYGAVARCLQDFAAPSDLPTSDLSPLPEVAQEASKDKFARALLASRWTASFRQESPTRWRFAQSGYDWRFERSLAAGESVFRLADGVSAFARAQWDRKWEARQAITGSSGVVDEAWLRSRLQALIGANWVSSNSGWAYQAGLAWVDRRLDGGGSRMAFHRNFLPHFWAFIPTIARPWGTDRLHLGLESTYFSSEGDPSIQGEGAKAWATEHRLNLRYEWALEDQAALSVLASFDLDKFNTGGRFEGGNAQFRVFF